MTQDIERGAIMVAVAFWLDKGYNLVKEVSNL
jgi:hypothetical protein